MNKIFSLNIIALLLASCLPKESVFENSICIENITTIDPIEGLKENQTVIIKGEKIFKISPTQKLKLSEKNKIVDGTGKYMIPGLWDAHIHFSYIEALAPSMFDLFLSYGITSVRDTGGRIEFVKRWKEQALANPTNAPRVMIAGPLLDGLPNVYDGSNLRHPPLSVGLATVDGVVKQVQLLDSLGIDFLKAYEMLTPEQFQMIMTLAREKGLKVTGHVPLSMDIISASNAGLNSMEHMRNLELSCASNSDELLAQRKQLLEEGKNKPGGDLRTSIHKAQRETAIENYDEGKADKIIEVLSSNQTWQIPTMALATVLVNRPFKQSHWQESFTYLPDSIHQRWNADIESIMKTEVPSFNQKYATWMMNMVDKINKARIDIMAGTDTPIAFLTPGLSLHEELRVLVLCGLTPLEAIKTATYNPAKYFNLENELGSIKENMWADLVILDANPLEDINNTRQINAVVKQGKYYDRNDLDNKLKRLRDE